MWFRYLFSVVFIFIGYVYYNKSINEKEKGMNFYLLPRGKTEEDKNKMNEHLDKVDLYKSLATFWLALGIAAPIIIGLIRLIIEMMIE